MPQSCVQNQLHIFLYCYCASGKFHHSWGIWSYPTEKNSRFLSFAGTENETEDLNIQTVDRNDTYITAWLALMYCIRAFVFQNLGGGGVVDEVDSSVVLPQPQCLVHECFELLYLYSWHKRQPTTLGCFSFALPSYSPRSICQPWMAKIRNMVTFRTECTTKVIFTMCLFQHLTRCDNQ